jgi:hypothetical protein
MAGRKKKAKKSATKRAKTVARKSKRTAKKPARKKTARKAAARKATTRKTAARKTARRPAKKKAEIGEGNYKASQRFRKSEEAFVERNRDNIAAMGREAEAALDGPEGGALIEAEAQGRSRAAE